jgi:all-trans-retinol 13,14-reductase
MAQTPNVRSTGSLSEEEHKTQDAIYAEKNHYDHVIIGSGIAGLTVASLLANAGKKVCVLEAHDIPGGYCHSFKMGAYHFCAQVHYIWGCAPGGYIYEFVKKLGLEKEITFELLDPKGYDHMVMPDGKRVPIPYGWDNLIEEVDKHYPGQKEQLKSFLDILSKIREELRYFPAYKKITLKELITKSTKFLTLLKYRTKTLQDVFDETGLSKEVQAVLIANAGDLMLPPEDLSIFGFTGLFGGYNTGAYYPTKHFKHYTERIAHFIQEKEGCHVFYETPVNKFNIEGDKIVSVETENGKTFTADNFICNADPQMISKMIGQEKFPRKQKKQLNYDYAVAGMVIYLGLKDIDLKEFGFGSYNIWHQTQWDMNQAWKEQLADNFENPWFFISTPTLHSNSPGTAPEGGQIMEIATVASYHNFKDAKNRSEKEYNIKKKELSERLLDLVEQYYVPNLRKHIAVKVVGTSVTNEAYVRAPEGNAYGSALTPKQLGLGRLRSTSNPWSNFYWCNASSGYGGVHGTTSTGLKLYMQLTGDNFFDTENMPTDDEFIAALPDHPTYKK